MAGMFLYHINLTKSLAAAFLLPSCAYNIPSCLKLMSVGMGQTPKHLSPPVSRLDKYGRAVTEYAI